MSVRGHEAPAPAGAHEDVPTRGMFASLRVPDYHWLWLSGWLWSFTRWMSLFLSAYLTNYLTGSPLQVQLIGALFSAPMFVGGLFGGMVSDRFDRRGTIMKQLGALVPVAALMGVVVLSGSVRVWMIALFVLTVGIGGVLDMTSRRALVYDMVGSRLITNAMALESIALMGGSMLGAQVAGAVINFVGLGQTYFVAAAAYLASWLCMAMMRPVPKERVATPTRGSTGQELLAGLRYVRAHGALKGVIGVTIVMNFFLFSYQTMIPVFADGLHVNAFWAGLLASAPGAGALVGAALIAGWASGRIGRGWIFVGGSAIAMVCLFTFAASGAYTLSLAALLIAGIGQSGFGTMQGSLTLTAAEPAMRGRVMGVLSMSIGVGPFGMATLGVVAQALGAPRAVMLSVGIGAVLLLLWAWRSPALRAIR